jgi:hypothetical protein
MGSEAHIYKALRNAWKISSHHYEAQWPYGKDSALALAMEGGTQLAASE